MALKIEKIPPGKTGYVTKLSATERKRLCTDYNPDNYGKDFVRKKTVAVCDCQGLHIANTADNVCVLCGHYTWDLDLTTSTKKIKKL